MFIASPLLLFIFYINLNTYEFVNTLTIIPHEYLVNLYHHDKTLEQEITLQQDQNGHHNRLVKKFIDLISCIPQFQVHLTPVIKSTKKSSESPIIICNPFHMILMKYMKILWMLKSIYNFHFPPRIPDLSSTLVASPGPTSTAHHLLLLFRINQSLSEISSIKMSLLCPYERRDIQEIE